MSHHLPLPDYVVELLRKQICVSCGAMCFKREQVTHVGLCLHRGRHLFFYATTCAQCDSPMNIVVTSQGEMTIERLAEEMGGQVPQPIDGVIPGHEPPPPSVFSPTRPHDGPINDDEVADLNAAMEQAETYEDVLRAIGLTHEGKIPARGRTVTLRAGG